MPPRHNSEALTRKEALVIVQVMDERSAQEASENGLLAALIPTMLCDCAAKIRHSTTPVNLKLLKSFASDVSREAVSELYDGNAGVRHDFLAQYAKELGLSVEQLRHAPDALKIGKDRFIGNIGSLVEPVLYDMLEHLFTGIVNNRPPRQQSSDPGRS